MCASSAIASDKNKGIIWAPTVDRYSELADASLPFVLLDPGIPTIRNSWTETIIALSTRAGGAQHLQAPRSSLNLVAVLGLAFEPIGLRYARLTNRNLILGLSIAELEEQITPPVKTLTIVAEARALTVSVVRDLYRISQKHGVHYGVITGADFSSASFFAAKAASFLSIPDRSSSHLDCIFETFSPDVIKSTLARNWTCCCIAAHGEGAHLLLGDTVLCGLVGGRELLNGIPLPRGCDDKLCKRVADLQSHWHSKALRADILGLLSCNSFSIAQQLSPTNTSLVLSAMTSEAVAILANPFGTEFLPGDCEKATTIIAGGTPLGEVAHSLSSICKTQFKADSFLLVGDPLCRVLPRQPRNDVSPWTSELTLPNRPSRKTVGQSILEARLITTALATVVDLRDDRHFSLLSALGRTQAKLESNLLEMGLESTLVPLMQEWDQCFGELVEVALLDRVVGDGLTDLLYRVSTETELILSTRCERCAEETMRITLASLFGNATWTLRDCPLCGILSFGDIKGPELTAFPPTDAIPGQIQTITITSKGPEPIDGWLIVDCRDKARGLTVTRSRKHISHLGLSFTVELPIPADAPFDQYSLRTVWISELRFSAARTMFFMMPNFHPSMGEA